MRTLQGKRCPGIVVEERGRPPGAIVTSSARRHSGLGELLTMNIRVTALTLRRRCLEIHAGDGEVGIFWSMARNADCGLMRAQQWK